MEHIKRHALVNYSAEQMYNLVNDIERYAQFLPYCSKAAITEQSEGYLSATLEVAKSGITKSFSTRNQLFPFERIHMELLDGPFTYLKGDWIFTALNDQACKIELNLTFEFSSKLTSMAFSGIFKKLVNKMVAAFTDRAEQIYN
ncbi:MAG: type II toxin-antitoxin system RatA family toxin [Gammaproteobacteria bacterium]|nr:type II toxin-antitoxin system RatA family toxin [Gammaproteobacteria bacterium]MDH5630738.1 type II toxin-antitoxin system RatA family toxin [Gammaproteobacteria bacterium]